MDKFERLWVSYSISYAVTTTTTNIGVIIQIHKAFVSIRPLVQDLAVRECSASGGWSVLLGSLSAPEQQRFHK